MDKEAYLISTLTSHRIGDDGAVIGDTIYSMDAFCEGVHFKREWMSPYQVGRKAMLVNLSDAVAMNADARYALVSVSIPDWMDTDAIDALRRGLEDTAEAFGCEIIGGDTIGGEKLDLSIALISHSDAPLLRTGVREGDILAYTGSLGESKRHLEALMRGESIPSDSRFFKPVLRRDFVREARPWLRAGMDISDGLYCDTNKLLELNEIGIEILKNIIPQAGESGEEYEMLVAFDEAHLNKLEMIAKACGTRLNPFARIVRNDFRFPCKSHHFD